MRKVPCGGAGSYLGLKNRTRTSECVVKCVLGSELWIYSLSLCTKYKMVMDDTQNKIYIYLEIHKTESNWGDKTKQCLFGHKRVDSLFHSWILNFALKCQSRGPTLVLLGLYLSC